MVEQDNGPVTQNANTDVPSWCRCGQGREMVELLKQGCCKIVFPHCQ